MKLRLAAIAALPLALAACDEAAIADFQAGLGLKKPVEQAAAPQPIPLEQLQPPKVTPLQQPIEIAGAEQVPAATANAETLNTQGFVAHGNEPFWSVDVSGKTALYKTPANPNGRKITVSRLAFAKGVEYIGVLGDSAFALTIRGTDCTDTMSGKAFPMTATLHIGGRANSGCAMAAEPPAPTKTAEAQPG